MSSPPSLIYTSYQTRTIPRRSNISPNTTEGLSSSPTSNGIFRPSSALSTASQTFENLFASPSQSPHHQLSRKGSDLSHFAFQPPTSPPLSGAELGSSSSKRTPYHPRFQPAGVRRDRTEEFVEARKGVGEKRRLDEQRVEKRAAKLVAIHFPTATSSKELRRTSTSSSILSLSSTISKSSSDVWSKTIKNLTLGKGGEGGEWEIRNAEQSLVKWQDDASVTRCPICMAHFSIKTRKHHCRLCGRVVCFLPPNSSPLSDIPTHSSTLEENDATTQREGVRTERCSTFITYHPNDFGDGTGRIVEIDIDEEAREKLNMTMNGHSKPDLVQKEKVKEENRKEIRVCRECLNSVLRRQHMTHKPPIPNYVKLHKVLIQVEEEVESLIPELQEFVINLKSIPPSSSSNTILSLQTQALTLRKKILSSLTSYDTLSRRIRDLPLQVSEGQKPGGSQERLAKAISTRAAMWLGEKMATLRGMGALESTFAGGDKALTSRRRKPENRHRSSFSTMASDESFDSSVDGKDRNKTPENGNPGILAILIEQEHLVTGYLEEANKKRQFEDAAALQLSLDELRTEIAKLRK